MLEGQIESPVSQGMQGMMIPCIPVACLFMFPGSPSSLSLPGHGQGGRNNFNLFSYL